MAKVRLNDSTTYATGRHTTSGDIASRACIVGRTGFTEDMLTRGVHGSGKPNGNPMGMGIAIRLMMGMGIKPMGMGIAYI